MTRFPTVVVRGEVLTSWLTVSDYTKSRLAAELGVSKGRVSQLLTSVEEPSAHLIAKLMGVTRLPFDRIFKLVRETPTPAKALQAALEMDSERRFRRERRGSGERRKVNRSHRSRRASARRHRVAR